MPKISMIPVDYSSSIKIPVMREEPVIKSKKIETLDEKNRRLAKQLDQMGAVYVWYGALDGLNLSYSTIKYFFDVLCTNTKNSSSDMMHEWAMTPVGIAVAAFESVSMIVLSMLANHFSDKDKNFLKRYIAVVWPYVRDTLKGLKNSYKGIRSLLYTLHEFGVQNVNFVMLPLALFLGALSVMNRIWYRDMKTKRKQMQDDNAKVREEILKEREIQVMYSLPEDKSILERYKNTYIWIEETGLYLIDDQSKIIPIDDIPFEDLRSHIEMLKRKDGEPIWLSQIALDRLLGRVDSDPKSFSKDCKLTDSQEDTFHNRIKRQTKSKKQNGLVSAAYGGLIDGLYLYMGVYALAAVMPPAFIIISIFSTFYVLINIISRVYEEYDYQQKLEISAAKAELALSVKKLKSRLYDCQEWCIDTHDDSSELDLLFERLNQERQAFQMQKKLVEDIQTVSFSLAFLSGLKNGLSAYGVIASFMFALGTIFLLSGIAFPPILLFIGVLSGLACLIGFTKYSMDNYAEEKNKIKKAEAAFIVNFLSEMDTMLDAIKKVTRDQPEIKNRFDALNFFSGNDNDPVADSSPQSFFQGWFETLRSFFSGAGKGVKAVDHVLNPLEEKDSAGHYHETSVMMVFIFLNVILNSIVLALRAYAREFGRSSPDDTVNNKTIEKVVLTPPEQSFPSNAADQRQPAQQNTSLTAHVQNKVAAEDINNKKPMFAKGHSRQSSLDGSKSRFFQQAPMMIGLASNEQFKEFSVSITTVG